MDGHNFKEEIAITFQIVTNSLDSMDNLSMYRGSNLFAIVLLAKNYATGFNHALSLQFARLNLSAIKKSEFFGLYRDSRFNRKTIQNVTE